MGLVYDLIYCIALVLTSPIWAFRLWRTGKWRTDWRSRFGHTPPLAHADPAKPTLLIHCVSVGEVNAVRHLVKALDQRTANGWNIVISATTDTGTARARELFAAERDVVRYPLDFTRPVQRFLDAIKPDMIVLTELEVWPNFIRLAWKRDVPICVINGRLSHRSFARYWLIRTLVRPTFSRLAAVAVQTPAYAKRFIALGVSPSHVGVFDTMKWDTAQIADQVDGADALAKAMGIDRSRPVIVAGSTGPREEKMLIRTCPKDAQLVLVPRKPERFDEVAALDPLIVRRTAHPDGTPRPLDGARLFLLDTMGELRKAYALADVVLVGRSFLGLYGSDLMEPVGLGKPTVIGPHHDDFADTVEALNAGGGVIVTDDPGRIAAELLTDKPRAAELARRGREVILSRQGATERHVQMLVEHMPAKRPR